MRSSVEGRGAVGMYFDATAFSAVISTTRQSPLQPGMKTAVKSAVILNALLQILL